MARDRRGRGQFVPRKLHVEPLEVRQLLSTTFTVTNTLDDGSPGSFRWAITQVDSDANDNAASPDRIVFALPASGPGYANGVWTIAPVSPLPAVSRPAVIDGYSQSGARPNTNGPGLADNAVLTVVLNGANAPIGASGLELSSSAITVRGLVVDGFRVSLPNFSGGDGIVIDGNGGDTIAGDFVGTNAAGSAIVANGGMGVFVSNVGNNTIGGATPDAVNVISGDSLVGIFVNGANASNNAIEGNFIGLGASGTTPVPDDIGVQIVGGAGNTIGGASAGAGNVIAANGGSGVYITGASASGNTVAGNLIGFSVDGSRNLGNSNDGVGIDLGASNNTIGGTTVGARNVIANSAEESDGTEGNVAILDGASHNVVEGNFLGTNVTGTAAAPGGSGSLVVGYSAKDNVIGGTTTGARNVIVSSSLGSHAVELVAAGTSGNLVEGNFIDVDVTGRNQLGGAGLRLLDASNNTIGGTSADARNVIAGVDVGSNDNLVEGNFIGTDATGTRALPQTYGFSLDGGSGNTIGGTAVGAGNVIAGSILSPTVSLYDASGNLLQGNFIGVDPAGTVSLGDPGQGIRLEVGATGNSIGGTTAGAGNVIADNALQGVLVADDTATGNAILGNSIFGNGKLGIDLAGGTEDSFGVTANSPGGPHTGPNDLQNYPVITSAIEHTVTGTLNAAPDTAYTIEIFTSPTIDPSSHGQGKTSQGLVYVVTDASGNASFTFNDPNDITGQFVTATATDPAGNTSEFALDVEATANTPPADVAVSVSTPTTTAGIAGQSVTFTFTVTNNGPNPAANVVLTNLLPAALSNPVVLSSDPALTTITSSGHTFTTMIASFPAGASFTESYTTTPDAVGTFADTLQVTGNDTPDPVPDNNAATTTLVVSAPAQTPTTTTITAPSPFAYGGQPLVFTVTVTPQLAVGSIPTGSFEVSVDGGPASSPLTLGEVNGVATLPFTLPVDPVLSVGTHTLAVTYDGDPHYAGSTATFTEVITRDTVSASLVSAPKPSVVGQPATFTMTVGVTGLTVPTGTVIFYDGSTPIGSVPLSSLSIPERSAGATRNILETFSAQFTTRILTPGTHEITAVYQGDADFFPATSNVVCQVVQPLPGGPAVVGFQRYGYHMQHTTVVLTFDEPIAVVPAENVSNYVIVPIGPRGRIGKPIAVKSASYRSATEQVVLAPVSRLNLHRTYRLTVNGTTSGGLTDTLGTLLDGNGQGHPGSNFVGLINRKILAGRSFMSAAATSAPRTSRADGRR